MDFLFSILDSKDEDEFDFIKDSKKSKKTPEFLNSNIKNFTDEDIKSINNLSEEEQTQSNNFFCFSKQDNQNNNNQITNNLLQNNNQILDDFDLFKTDSLVPNKSNFTRNLQNISSIENNNNQ